MMTARTATVLSVAAMVALAGWAHKPKQLPPPPPESSVPSSGDTSAPSGNVGGSIVPGSRADFLQQVGTDTVHFDTDKSDVNSEGQGILAQQAKWLVAH